MRVLVVGAGGVGGYYGARLAAAGHDVRFLARGATLEALRREGLTLRSDFGDVRLEQVHAVASGAESGPVDAMLFCVKTYDNGAAAEAAEGAVEAGTVVCSLQNGVDNETFLRHRWPAARVVGGTSRIEAFVESPGIVVQVGAQQDVTVGAFEERDRAAAAAVAEAFRGAGVPVTVADDVIAALWTKLVIIAGLGGVTAYARRGIGEVVQDPALHALLADALQEAEDVGRARGVAVPPGFAQLVLAYAGTQLDPRFRSSMARDVERGRPLEVEAINGAVVGHGEQSGLATPANHVILDALLPLHREALARRDAS